MAYTTSLVEHTLNTRGVGSAFASSLESYGPNTDVGANLQASFGKAVSKISAAKDMAANISEAQAGLANAVGFDANAVGAASPTMAQKALSIGIDVAASAALATVASPLAAVAYNVATAPGTVSTLMPSVKASANTVSSPSEPVVSEMDADDFDPWSYESFADGMGGNAAPAAAPVAQPMAAAAAQVAEAFGFEAVTKELASAVPTTIETEIAAIAKQGEHELAQIADFEDGPKAPEQNIPRPEFA